MRLTKGNVLIGLALVTILLLAWVLPERIEHLLTLAAFWVRDTQATLQGALVDAVKAWQAHPGLAGLAPLTTACFLYGVFHAVGPGHGKAVLAAYAAATRVRIRRVMLLAGLTALVQATVAVALVGTGFLIAGTGMRWISRKATDILEPASYAAIMLVGLWLVVGALRPLMDRLWRKTTRGSLAPRGTAVPPSDPQGHDHGHEHGHGPTATACRCHDHAPPPTATEGRSGVALALAAGLRPCTGSLLVVALCFGLGFWTLGIAASYAIGAGTAVTVALLAGGVAATRGPAAAVARLARLPDNLWRRLSLSVRMAGGALILILGAIMLQAALTAPRHPFG